MYENLERVHIILNLNKLKYGYSIVYLCNLVSKNAY